MLYFQQFIFQSKSISQQMLIQHVQCIVFEAD
jgi:hypothetical protein